MLRSKVLASFRALHRARKDVFKGDTAALEAARQRINQEFEKHKTETDPSKIEELVKVAEDTAVYVRQMVVQAQMNEAGRYALPRIGSPSGLRLSGDPTRGRADIASADPDDFLARRSTTSPCPVDSSRQSGGTERR
ncbi:hypothetical protein Bbelb_191680 [Branchiostoma belcheri]|nr:hypothetical protein Bbelb_191680 [Branchiostoma belcheri]